MSTYDAVIVGAGPAGLSAALVLGRCRRRVLVCDSQEYRNAASHALHAYLGHDGTPPASLRAAGRVEIRRYPSVEFLDGAVSTTHRTQGRFEVLCSDGRRIQSRTLLLATGVIDEHPPLAGFGRLYGHSIFHCPYCDGWERRDQSIAVFGQGDHGIGLALEMTVWSRDLILFTNGPSGLRQDQLDRLDRLDRNSIGLEQRPIAALIGSDGQLEAIQLADGAAIARRAMFFKTDQRERSGLAASLGCTFNSEGTVETGNNEATNVPGLFVAGDASRSAQLAIVAAAEGAQAAAAINTRLLREDLL